MKYIIDTNVLIEWERGNKEAAKLLKRLVASHDVAISMITITEYLVGAHIKKRLELAHRILGQFAVVSYDLEVANITAQIIAERRGTSNPIIFPDIVVEASARVSKRVLITEDKKHFKNAITIKDALKQVKA